MPVLTDSKVENATETDASVADRRRPGRVQNVSAELIPILRNQPSETMMIEFEEVDQAAPLRGLFFGVLLSLPIWVAIAYLVSLFLSR